MANTFKFGNGNWAVKDGYALAYNDENNNFKPLPFDFTRASSATRVNKQGLVEVVPSGKPRIDFTDNTSGHLLLEPSRTNTFQRSEEFDNAYWSTSRIETPTKEGVVDPSGGLDAYTLEMSTGQTSGGGIFKTGISISGDNSMSVFAKKKNANYLVLADTGTTTYAVYFDLENGFVGTEYSATGEIQDFGNGWYRCIMKYNATNSNAKFIYLSDIDGQTSNGVTGGDSIYIWGAQYELSSSYPTSYIPTEGSSVTRVAETCRNAGSSQVIGQSEGVVFVDIKGINLTNTSQSIGISDGTSTNRFDIRINTSNVVSAVGVFGGVVAFSMGSYVASQSDDLKIALSYKNNEFKLFVNGSKNAEDTSGTVSGTFTEVSCDLNDSQVMNSPIKEIKLYNTALTDTELQNLTS